MFVIFFPLLRKSLWLVKLMFRIFVTGHGIRKCSRSFSRLFLCVENVRRSNPETKSKKLMQNRSFVGNGRSVVSSRSTRPHKYYPNKAALGNWVCAVAVILIPSPSSLECSMARKTIYGLSVRPRWLEIGSGQIFLTGHSEQSRAGKIAPSCPRG